MAQLYRSCAGRERPASYPERALRPERSDRPEPITCNPNRVEHRGACPCWSVGRRSAAARLCLRAPASGTGGRSCDQWTPPHPSKRRGLVRRGTVRQFPQQSYARAKLLFDRNGPTIRPSASATAAFRKTPEEWSALAPPYARSDDGGQRWLVLRLAPLPPPARPWRATILAFATCSAWGRASRPSGGKNKTRHWRTFFPVLTIKVVVRVEAGSAL